MVDVTQFVEPSASFDDISGLEEIKNTLRRIASSAASSFEKHEAGIKGGSLSILLYGQAGTEKSLLAQALAKECKAKFISIESSALLFGCTAWSNMSNTEWVKALFSEAEKNAPSIIFLEGVDIISQYTPNWDMKPLDQLLRELDKPRNGVIIIASASKPEIIKENLFLRFSYKLEVTLPDEATRREVINTLLKNFGAHAKKNNIVEPEYGTTDIEELVKETEGFSGAEILLIWQKTLINSIPFEEILDPKEKITLKPYNFKTSLEEVKQERKNKL
jgi:transitional endoplasmic reticulum ATPase